MDQNNKPPFSKQPPFNRPRGQTGRLSQPNRGPVPQQPPPAQQPPNAVGPGQRSSLDSSDSIQVSGQVGPMRKEPPPVVHQKNEMFLPPGVAAIKNLEDGAKIVRYTHPQKLGKLLKDAKANIGGESSRFFGKGWVIGNGIAKIAPDGTSIIYYPDEISDLVRDLLGPDSETL